MMDWNPTRRTVLGGVTGLAALAVGAGATADFALGGGPHGIARSFDTNDDGDAEMVIRRVSDPPGNRGGTAINATSDGADTPDYAASLVRLAGDRLTLGDLVDDGFAYDYYEDSASTSPGPDEAWVVLTTSARGEQGRHALFRKMTDDRAPETWRTRDVASELEGDVDEGEPWKEFDVGGRSIETVGDDVVAAFGADARVQWAGVGRGSPGWKSFVADTYFDGVTVAGEERSMPVTESNRNGPPEGRSTD